MACTGEDLTIVVIVDGTFNLKLNYEIPFLHFNSRNNYDVVGRKSTKFVRISIG